MTRIKTFANGGTLLPTDLNSIQDYVDSQDSAITSAWTTAMASGAVGNGSIVADKLNLATRPTSFPGITWNSFSGAFGTSWSDSWQCSYGKDINGQVHLRGRATTSSSTNFLIATLPVGYRPTMEQAFAAVMYSPGGPVRFAMQVFIYTDGTISVYYPNVMVAPYTQQVGSICWLDSVHFIAGA